VGQKEAMNFLNRLRSAAASLSREQRWFVLWTVLAMGVLAWLAIPGPRAAKAGARLAALHAEGQPGGTADYVAYWIPKAGLGGLMLAGLLLLAVKGIVRPVPAAAITFSRAPRKQGWWLAAFSACVIGWSAWANAPRLEFGLWGDEESTMRKSVVGQFERNKDGKLELDAVNWTETVFRYRDPNNHPLNSVLSRLSHTAFARDLTQPDGFYFDERAMRLPVFFAGLLGLAAMAWVGWTLGKPMLGGLAVALLATHPWFVRYGVETRGYGFLLLFTPLALGCLIRAAQIGKWRWWIGYGLAQFLILWSYPGAVHLLVALNVAAVCLVVFLTKDKDWRKAQAGRWLTACALGATLCTVMMLPLVQPLMFYLKTPRMQGPMPSEWYPDAAAWLVTGVPWRPWDAGNPLCWSWIQALSGTWSALGLAGIGLVLVAGAAGWWRQGRLGRALLQALVLHAPLFILQSHLVGGFIYTWYLFPALTGLMLLAAGICWFPNIVRVPAFLVLALPWLAVTPAAVKLLREHPIEQMREGTKLTRPVSLASDPRIDDVMTVDIIMTTRGYDPAVLPLKSDDPNAFRAFLREADAKQKPLFVHFGSPDFADSARPQVMALVRNPALFEPIATLPGMDGPYTRQVFRYKMGTVPPG
jgi:hypothetical protein